MRWLTKTSPTASATACVTGAIATPSPSRTGCHLHAQCPYAWAGVRADGTASATRSHAQRRRERREEPARKRDLLSERVGGWPPKPARRAAQARSKQLLDLASCLFLQQVRARAYVRFITKRCLARPVAGRTRMCRGAERGVGVRAEGGRVRRSGRRPRFERRTPVRWGGDIERSASRQRGEARDGVAVEVHERGARTARGDRRAGRAGRMRRARANRPPGGRIARRNPSRPPSGPANSMVPSARVASTPWRAAWCGARSALVPGARLAAPNAVACAARTA